MKSIRPSASLVKLLGLLERPAAACPFCGKSSGESLGTFALLAGAFLWMRSIARRRRRSGLTSGAPAAGVQ